MILFIFEINFLNCNFLFEIAESAYGMHMQYASSEHVLNLFKANK